MASMKDIDLMNNNIAATPFYSKALGCIVGGVIGDALGTPSEGKTYTTIKKEFGWIDTFEGTGTDDTIMKNLLGRALIKTGGHAGSDEWAMEWLDDWGAIFGHKVHKFFISVIHTANKLRLDYVPRMAGLGNMPSSSSAMAISPVGIVNACRPRQAAAQAYEIASLIHIHDVGFCQDAAAAIAAAVAEAFNRQATADSIINAATIHLHPVSGREMKDRIEQGVALARQADDFEAFCQAVYGQSDYFFKRIFCDSRETVPLTLALLTLAKGDFEKSVTYGANFGRDADTIACMVGGIAGALAGAEGIKAQWLEKVLQEGEGEEALAVDLVQTAISKDKDYQVAESEFGALLG